MMSQTSENTIFVRFYFTLCYLMVTGGEVTKKGMGTPCEA